MELYIIRHAQSTNNALGADISKRTRDAPLTDLGHKQAARLAEHLASGTHIENIYSRSSESLVMEERHGYGITRLYCSAMHRALQTAHPVSAALGIKPHVWVDIHEQGGIYMDEADGKRVGYPGLTRVEISAQFEGYVLPEDVTDVGWWNRDYENIAASQGRAIRVAEQLWQWATISPEERIAMISHGTFIGHLIKALFNQLPGKDIAYNQYNTAISHIHLDANGRVSMRYLNKVDHLPLRMITA